MTEGRLIASKADGSGRLVSLRTLPRTHFPELGYQTGLRLVTTQDGESIYEQTIGLDDSEILALLGELGRGL